MKTHIEGDECPGCEIKLRDAHSDLADIYRMIIKPKFKDCHISWTFRDKISQNQAVAEGKSKLAWPVSAHNKCDDEGNPCALAIDLFELCNNGMARWSYAYFRAIANDLKDRNQPIQWGGDWNSIGDSDHFEMLSKINLT